MGSCVTCCTRSPDVCLRHREFLFLLRAFNVVPRCLVLFGVDFDDKGPERERQRES